MSTSTLSRPFHTVSSGTWWHSAALAPMQTMVSNASPSPRSTIIRWIVRAISRSVMPARKRFEASRQISQASRSAARMRAISSAVFTARTSAMASEKSTNSPSRDFCSHLRNRLCATEPS